MSVLSTHAQVEVQVSAIEGTNFWVSPPGAIAWVPASSQIRRIESGSRLRSGPDTRITLQFPGRGVMRIPENTELEILRPQNGPTSIWVALKRGLLYFFHRGEPGDIEIHSRTSTAGIRGTEFAVEVDHEDNLIVSVVEGQVELRSAAGNLSLDSGQRGGTRVAAPPLSMGAIDIPSTLQWCLYYPRILDPAELHLPPEAQLAMEPSLQAFGTGDILAALALRPPDREPQSSAERLYLAALHLSVGQVGQAESLLRSMAIADRPQAQGGVEDSSSRIASAHLRLIRTVRGQESGPGGDPETVAEWLADSYAAQAVSDLPRALRSSRQAVLRGSESGLAWTRVAELEFAFGRTREAMEAADRALRLAPPHGPLLALRGFLLSARNRNAEALAQFEAAIRVSGGLGDVWMGLALCKIRTGRLAEGIADLEVACALEPQRSLLRSYLGKAYDQAGRTRSALAEFDRAETLDPDDPSPWLYRALLHHQQRQPLLAVRDLERSQVLGDHRQVFRSRSLLDQDRATRRASLADVYQRAGLTNAGLNEAILASAFSPANHSAHLFLAEGFQALRDPTRFGLRYEAGWFQELTLSQILAPVGAARLSQHPSLQEYSRLLEQDGSRMLTDSEYRSDGQFREWATYSGRFGSTAFSLDLDQEYHRGVRPNNDLSRLELYARIHQELTPEDSVLLFAKYQDFESGDNFQYWNPMSELRAGFRFVERQDPLLMAAYHHQWSPESHSLLMAARLINDQRVQQTGAGGLLLIDADRSGTTDQRFTLPYDLQYHSEFETYVIEAQQLVDRHTGSLVLGGRVHTGRVATSDQLVSTSVVPTILESHAVSESLQRVSAYVYISQQLGADVLATVGLNVDQLRYPTNFRNPPIASGVEVRSRLNPKTALLWTPSDRLAVRAAYLQAMGGLSYDESFRLEPAQVSGFLQSFRTLISESVVGSITAPAHDIAGLAASWGSADARTRVTMEGDLLNAEVDRDVGVFQFGVAPVGFSTGTTRETLRYDQVEARASLERLVSDLWTLGLDYRFTRSMLKSAFPEIPKMIPGGAPDQDQLSDLQQLGVHVLFHHPGGLFAGVGASAFHQSNRDERYDDAGGGTWIPRETDDTFMQANLHVGYRFPRDRGDITVGLLNVGGSDYRLNPLTPYAELPRERTYTIRLRLQF